MPPQAGVAQKPAKTSTLTGERPLPGITPDSLLALHDAGYQAVAERVGAGWVLDVGCGEGFESARLGGDGRVVVGVDYDVGALGAARLAPAASGLHLAATDACRLGLGTGRFDWVCSSHVVEHFADPAGHLAELARVLTPDGTAFVLTPNAPADFENPFHLTSFLAQSLDRAMHDHFHDVWVGGLEGSPSVKADFERRRRRANRLLRLDVLDLRHRLPRSWYVAAYTHLLPIAYRLLARSDTSGHTGITADDFFVTDRVEDSTPVLFAIGRRPRTGVAHHGS